MCLVHSGGPGGHSDHLRFPALHEHMTMVYLDPVGSGESDLLPDGDYSMSRYGDFAAAVLDELGAQTAYFLGHSHGGFVALQFGIDRPERLRGLILHSTAPVNAPLLMENATREMAAFVERWPARPEAVDAGLAWKEMREQEAAPSEKPAEKPADDPADATKAKERYLARVMPAYLADFRKTVADLGATPVLRYTVDPNRLPVIWDVRNLLHTIQAPTLVITGAYDFICAPVYARAIAAGLPNARLHELPESGHFGHIEQPGEFVTAVIEFISATEHAGETEDPGDVPRIPEMFQSGRPHEVGLWPLRSIELPRPPPHLGGVSGCRLPSRACGSQNDRSNAGGAHPPRKNES